MGDHNSWPEVEPDPRTEDLQGPLELNAARGALLAKWGRPAASGALCQTVRKRDEQRHLIRKRLKEGSKRVDRGCRNCWHG